VLLKLLYTVSTHLLHAYIYATLNFFAIPHERVFYNTEHTLLNIIGDISKLFKSRQQAQICTLNFIMSWFNIHNLLEIRIILSPLCSGALLTP